MSPSPSLEELTALRGELIEAVFGATPDGAADDALAQVLGDAGLPLGPEAAFNAATQTALSTLLQASGCGQRELLLNDIDLLRRVQASQQPETRYAPYGVVFGLYPIRVKGQLRAALRTGPLKQGGPTPEEARTLGALAGSSEAEALEALEGIPSFAREDLERIFALYQAVANAASAALEANASRGELLHQLVESERARSLGSLSGGIAHHFNGLLSVILGYTSFVQNNEDLRPEVSEALGKVALAAQRGRRLTEELLAFEGGEGEEPCSCSLHETLESVLSLITPQSHSRIRFEEDCSAENDQVHALRSELHQIIFNLLASLVDRLMESGGDIQIRTENVIISDQDHIRVEVRDSGGYATHAGAEPLTDQLLALDEEEEARNLSSLYGMIKRLEGTLLVTTDEDEVTRVEILLPVHRSDPTPAEGKRSRPPQRASRIWVLDDDPLFRDMCVQILRQDGHEVREYEAGPDLMDAVAAGEEWPDLMIMDFSMPDYNGLEMRRWFKEQGAPVPVIMVSGLSPHQPDIRAALEIRKTFFLQKPFSYTELSDIASVAMGETLIGE